MSAVANRAEAERDLLRRARSSTPADREAAFTEIFRNHRERVLALCTNLLGQRSDAADALQETFLAVHRGLPGFRGEAAMDSFPANHRVVLSLFATEGLGHAEIARILGVPEGTVWSRPHLARRKLSQAMGNCLRPGT